MKTSILSNIRLENVKPVDAKDRVRDFFDIRETVRNRRKTLDLAKSGRRFTFGAALLLDPDALFEDQGRLLIDSKHASFLFVADCLLSRDGDPGAADRGPTKGGKGGGQKENVRTLAGFANHKNVDGNLVLDPQLRYDLDTDGVFRLAPRELKVLNHLDQRMTVLACHKTLAYKERAEELLNEGDVKPPEGIDDLFPRATVRLADCDRLTACDLLRPYAEQLFVRSFQFGMSYRSPCLGTVRLNKLNGATEIVIESVGMAEGEEKAGRLVQSRVVGPFAHVKFNDGDRVQIGDLVYTEYGMASHNLPINEWPEPSAARDFIVSLVGGEDLFQQLAYLHLWNRLSDAKAGGTFAPLAVVRLVSDDDRKTLGLTEELYWDVTDVADYIEPDLDAVVLPPYELKTRENRLLFSGRLRLGGQSVRCVVHKDVSGNK